MGKGKKIGVLILAIIMIFTMSTSVFAAEADLSGHSYKAYQVFAGTQAKYSPKLAQIKWGNGVNGENMLAALKKDAELKDLMQSCTTAEDVAKAISPFADTTSQAKAFARAAYANRTGDGTKVVAGQTDLAAGYYIIVDVTERLGKDDIRNIAVLQLTNKSRFDIKTKVDKPSVIKQVDDKNDSIKDEDGENWQDSADYDIGDNVPFKLTATLPTKLNEYKVYKIVFKDRKSKGLSQAKNFVVKIGEKELTSNQYTVIQQADGFNLVINDVIQYGAKPGEAVTVEYTSMLNEYAQIGSAGNEDTVSLEYSNDANYIGEGCKSPTSETPKDKVKVFTYELKANKVNQNCCPLKGAGFTLYKFIAAENKYLPVGQEVKGKDMTEFIWKGLDAGQYKISETTVPDGYNPIADQEFKIEATHEVTSDDPQLIKLSATAINQSKIEFWVEEIETKCDPQKGYTGKIITKIVNKEGIELPETGGIGTTIIYTIGGILVALAGLLLAARRRTNSK